MNRRSWLVLCLILVACFTTACTEKIAEKTVEKSIEQQGGGKVDVDTDQDGGFSLKTEDGSMSVGSKAKLPASFPASLPLPSDSTLLTVVELQNAWTLTYQVKSPEVVEAIVDVLKASNYTQIAAADYGQMKTWVLENDAYNVSVGVSTDDEKFAFSYYVGVKE